MNLHADIERVALLGWRCVPVTRHRAGFFRGYIDAATTDLDQLDQWSTQYPRANWVVVPTGSGVWALDIDCLSETHKSDGILAMRQMIEKNFPLPDRPHGRSGGGGHLMVFRDNGDPIRTKSGWPVPGIDPRAGLCSFTISPSTHRNGQPYYWIVAPWEVAPPKAPDWLLKKVAPPKERTAKPWSFAPTSDKARGIVMKAIHKISDAPPGTANDTLNKQAFNLGSWCAAGVLHEAEACDSLYSAARHRGIPPREAHATIKSGFTSGLKNPVQARHVG